MQKKVINNLLPHLSLIVVLQHFSCKQVNPAIYLKTGNESPYSIIIVLFPQNYTDWLGGAVPVMSAAHDDQQFQYGGVLFLKINKEVK